MGSEALDRAKGTTAQAGRVVGPLAPREALVLRNRVHLSDTAETTSHMGEHKPVVRATRAHRPPQLRFDRMDDTNEGRHEFSVCVHPESPL